MQITNHANSKIQKSPTKTTTVLLADDDEFVRDFTKTVLTMAGYDVIDAVNGEDAILKYELFRDRINIAVLDAIMPGKNGIEAFAAMRELDPNIKVIFTSRYVNDRLIREYISNEGLPLISKPFSPNELLQQILHLLWFDHWHYSSPQDTVTLA